MFQPDGIQVDTIENNVIHRTKTVTHQFLFPLFIARVGSNLPPPAGPGSSPPTGECTEVGKLGRTALGGGRGAGEGAKC